MHYQKNALNETQSIAVNEMRWPGEKYFDIEEQIIYYSGAPNK